MIEEINVMKLVDIYLKRSSRGGYVSVYISLATINKIKKGEYKYPYLQITNNEISNFINVNEITDFVCSNKNIKTRDELENKMFKTMEDNKPYDFFILVDEANGF